ncbi:MAG: hypothetical protein ACKODB_01735, partial [Betaproteobacteria bacterium]
HGTTRASQRATLSAHHPGRGHALEGAAMLARLLFGEWPTASALAGGAIIVWATVWIARREARGTGARDPQAPV